MPDVFTVFLNKDDDDDDDDDTSPGGGGGGLYSEGRFHGGFFELRVWGAYTWRGLFSEFYGNFSMGFKKGHIPVVSNAHLLEF